MRPPSASARPSGLQIVDLPVAADERQAAEQALQRLFLTVFAHEIDAATWAWKYHQAPRSHTVNLVALDDQGWAEPCGHVGCLVLPGRWRGRPVWMAHLTDVMVHPRARGGMEAQSVYGRLMRAMAQRLAALHTPEMPLFAYGFPGRLPSRLGQRMGLYRPLRPDESQPVWAHDVTPTGTPKPTPWARWRETLGPGPRVQPLLDPQTLQRAALAGQIAIDATAPQAPCLQKDAAYLDWRYRRHPHRRYELWSVLGRFNRPVGWVVTGAEQGAWVIDAHLPWPWQQGPGWGHVLEALTQASGRHRWQGWRGAGGAHRESCEASLIVPGEFRWRDLCAQAPQSDPSNAAAAPSPTSSPAPSAAFSPAFYPGDTDVF